MQEFWEDYTGIRPARVRVIAGEQAIAVCLEGVLSPAERQMASTRAGCEMLEELEERILDEAKPYLRQLVEEATEREGVQVQVRPDVASGNVLGFFRLE
jgi:uncharacterized protein YbcI